MYMHACDNVGHLAGDIEIQSLSSLNVHRVLMDVYLFHTLACDP